MIFLFLFLCGAQMLLEIHRRNWRRSKKIDPPKFRSSARKRRLGIAGIGVIGRCTLKFLGPFEVSYIPPKAHLTKHIFTVIRTVDHKAHASFNFIF